MQETERRMEGKKREGKVSRRKQGTKARCTEKGRTENKEERVGRREEKIKKTRKGREEGERRRKR